MHQFKIKITQHLNCMHLKSNLKSGKYVFKIIIKTFNGKRNSQLVLMNVFKNRCVIIFENMITRRGKIFKKF